MPKHPIRAQKNDSKTSDPGKVIAIQLCPASYCAMVSMKDHGLLYDLSIPKRKTSNFRPR